jgi:hypothetical protein
LVGVQESHLLISVSISNCLGTVTAQLVPLVVEDLLLCHQGRRNRDASSELRAGISVADVAMRRYLSSPVLALDAAWGWCRNSAVAAGPEASDRVCRGRVVLIAKRCPGAFACQLSKTGCAMAPLSFLIPRFPISACQLVMGCSWVAGGSRRWNAELSKLSTNVSRRLQLDPRPSRTAKRASFL